MQWGSWGDFLHMGGYGLYVGGSYGVTVLVMLFEAVAVRHRHRLARMALQTDPPR